jgi:hypothetical protein
MKHSQPIHNFTGMNLRISLCLFLAVNSAMAGGSKRPSAPVPSHRTPKSGAKVYKPAGQWDIKGISDIPKGVGSVAVKSGVIVWDLQGAVLDGEKQKGKLDDNENNEPLFRARVPLVVKNGFARNVKNAMTFFAKDSGVEKMTFTDCGEDCIATAKGRSSSARAYGFRVIDSEIIGRSSGDKSLQLNEAKDARVEGNTIYGGITCMRIGDSDTTQVSDVAIVKNNRYVACDTGNNASRITVHTSGNKFESVNTPWKASNGAVEK